LNYISSKINVNLKIIYMSSKITPLSDRVLIKVSEAETKTASGIIIPDNAQEKPQKGTVVAAGKGTKDNPITVKIGDTVLYGKFSGTELKHDGEEFIIMREADIFAIIS
jgi:chaperonin GroES